MKNLKTHGAALYAAIQKEFDLSEPSSEALLLTACQCLDRIHECRAFIEAEGLLVQDRFGQSKPHPLVVVERDARGQMMTAIKQLGLDIEPLNAAPGRPPYAY